MFSQEIAQATTSTDATLQNLNVKLDLLKEEYNAIASQPNTYSFFNLDNIYFWFVLAGLLLLAFGLLFLLAEIQNKSDKVKKNKKESKSEQLDRAEEDNEPVLGGVVASEEPEPTFEVTSKVEVKQSKAKGPIKIKVEKIK